MGADSRDSSSARSPNGGAGPTRSAPNKTVAFGLNQAQPNDTFPPERKTMTLTYSAGISAFTLSFG